MAYFKLDPAFLKEHSDVAWTQDPLERDKRQKGIFLKDVLPIILKQGDNGYGYLKELVWKNAWLQPLLGTDMRLSGLRPEESTLEGLEIESIVEHLSKNPFDSTLVMADFVRLCRCWIFDSQVMEREDASWYYAIGKANSLDREITSFSQNLSLRNAIRAKYQNDIETIERIHQDNGRDIRPGVRTFGEEVPSEFIKAIMEAKVEVQAVVWGDILKKLDGPSRAKQEDSIWNACRAVSRDDRWEKLKDEVREICVKSGSPIPHDDPLENIAELRKHLDRHHNYYTTIYELNKQLEFQQRIITNVSFRHLLESLPGPNKDKKRGGDRERWDRFWGSAIQLAEFEKDRDLDETNREFEEAWKRERKDVKRQEKEVQEHHGHAGSAPKHLNGHSKFKEKAAETLSMANERCITGGMEAYGESEAANSRDTVIDDKKKQKMEGKKNTMEENLSEAGAHIISKSEAEEARLNSIRKRSPLVALLQKFPSKDSVKNEGYSLYSRFSENIHQYRERAYHINESQWDTLPYHLLNAMRPVHYNKVTGKEDWAAEKKRYVLDIFV
ncbi:hypothetical protein HYFRA_00004731 [Hymenoscyphus fraxineus]|uniref:Uncharacterized protein n=1 Tax=Hymenoscyphus fraxineus TaxID=746836 RepID=A0A9N9KVY6_9HELO|nr:hypothetical protein HYFRA_00004731 [Hymenoscyphus fraxineus]